MRHFIAYIFTLAFSLSAAAAPIPGELLLEPSSYRTNVQAYLLQYTLLKNELYLLRHRPSPTPTLGYSTALSSEPSKAKPRNPTRSSLRMSTAS
jgi:hypothetical protein